MLDNKYIENGKDIIQQEINALKKLKNSIKKTFSEIVKKMGCYIFIDWYSIIFFKC